MGTIRSNKNPGVIYQEEHSNSSRTHRNVKHGVVQESIDDNIATETLIGQNKHVLLSNRNAAVQYVAFGGSTIVVTTGANGVPILAGQSILLCSGTDDYIKTTHADVHMMIIED